MTVLNDYGYPAHVLPSLGALDNWGKQILYCKVKGGALRAENGTAWPMTYDSMNSVQRLTAMGEGFYYWDWDVVKADKLEAMDSFKTGEVEACHFAAKAFGGSADQPSTGDSSWNKVFTSPSTYPDAADWAAQVDYSAGTVTTAQSMLAMHEAGYIEYIPFKSRMSPFYSRDWVEWNVMDQGTGLGIFGMGGGTLNSVHYTVQPFGYYTVGNSTMFSHDGGVAATAGTAKIIDDLPANYQIAGQTSNSMDKKFTSAYWLLPGRGEALKKFTHWKQTDLGKYYEQLDDISHLSAAEAQGSVLVNKLYSWTATEAQSGMRQNVLSRQMQREALAHAQCAGFICIIVVQWADLMICKTRWLSIAQQGMVNPVMNFGLLFETILGCFLCYVPGLGDVLGTRPLRWTHWFPGLPFCLFIFFYDETRKYLMRATSTKMRDKDTKRMLNYPGWLERMTYY